MLLLNSLKLVSYENVSSMNVFIKFVIESMKYLGFWFVFDRCASCGAELNENNVGFIFDAMPKSELFKTVILDGSLPRKTFSMGHSYDKRYYLEARKIK